MAVTGKAFDVVVLDLMKGYHAWHSHTLKIALSNVAPVATNSVFADITEIAAGNGYTAGGATCTVSALSQTSGSGKLVIDDVIIAASGGSISTFRYAILYNSTQTTPPKPLIGWWDLGSAITLSSGQSYSLDFDPLGAFLLPKAA